MDLLLQFIEQRTGKELTKRDIKPITKFFNGSDGYTLPGWIKHTIYRRWCHTGAGRQLVWTYLPLVAELFKAFGNGIFYSHNEITSSQYDSTEFCAVCVRNCVYHESNLCYREYAREYAATERQRTYLTKSILHSENGGLWPKSGVIPLDLTFPYHL